MSPALGAMLAFVALVATGMIYQAVGTARDARRLPPPGRLVPAGRSRRHICCVGEGAPSVVFEAGIAASSLSWTHLAPAVGAFTRACRYDRAGLGWSDPLRGRVTAATLASDLKAVLQSAAAGGPHVLVAHSFGTLVVREFARRYPADTAALVLIDPVDPAEWMTMSTEMRQRLTGGVFLSQVGALLASVGFVRLCLDLLQRGSTGLPRRASRLFGTEAATTLGRLVGEVQKLPREAWPMAQAHWSRPAAFRSMAAHLSALPRCAAEIAAAPGLGDLPVTVISAGTQSAAGREAHARLAASSTRGQLVVAERAGHWLHLDAPGIVLDAIRAHVEAGRRAQR